MKRIGMIRAFSTYTAQQMEQTKVDLELKMSVQELFYCASYYKVRAQRDPAIDELKMLDRLSELRQHTAAAAAPVELLTNDAFTAGAYADMMNKRRTMRPNAKHPCSLQEAFTLANDYLLRAGKSPDHSSAIATINDPTALEFFACKSHVVVSESNHGLRIFSKNKEKPQSTDLVVLPLPLLNSNGTKAEDPLGNLLNDSDFIHSVKQMKTVDTTGLLWEVLRMSDGAYFDLKRLSRTGEALPLSVLTDAYAGQPILRIAKDTYEKLFYKAHQHGIHLVPVAALTPGTEIMIEREKGCIFTLQSDFIRSLFRIRAFTAKLENENTACSPGIKHHPITDQSCPYLLLGKEQDVAQIASVEDYAVSAASCDTETNHFRNSVYTLLAPMISLALSGCDGNDHRLVLQLDIPEALENETAMGNVMSSILGCYRVQTECSIPASDCKIQISPDCNAPKLSCFAIDKGIPCPSEFTAAGNKLYCIRPKLLPNGLPEFAAIRALMAELTAWSKQGIVKSARVLCGESVTDALQKMKTDRFYAHFTSDFFASDGPVPLAIVLETASEIPAQLIGRVGERTAITLTAPTQAVQLSCTSSLTLYKKPRIAVFAKLHDSAAKMLTARLSEKGAEVILLTNKTEEWDIAAALLSAQTLIMCGHTTLPETERIHFALDTMRRAGGCVLGVGHRNHLGLEDEIFLSNGIPNDFVEQICAQPNIL